MSQLRPVDLARAAGISAQQVRNYADAGILPATPRSASGHRRFSARHRDALLTYRALMKGFGPRTAEDIMHAVHADDVAAALALVDAGHAALHEQRLSLRAAGEALEAIAKQSPDTAPLPRSRMRIGEVAEHLGVRTSALRLWEAEGLLAPGRDTTTGFRYYEPTDIRDARMITMLRRSRYPLDQIRPILDGVRETGSSEALREAIARRQSALTRQGADMLAAASHLHRYIAEPAHSA